jgi:colanic acid biosynthesis glycosyl transferase WcaI
MLENGFPPEFSSRLPYEMAAGLAAGGHGVVVATVRPRRYAMAPIPTGVPGKDIVLGDPRGVSVVRSGFPLNGSSLPARMVENLLVPLFVLVGGLRSPPPDVVHAGSPPFFLGWSCALLARILRKPSVLRIQDVHPDALVRLGFLRNRIIVAAMEWLERLLYRSMDQITVIGESYLHHVISKGIPRERVHLIPNWGPSLPPFIPDMREELGWGDEFVITYAGSMSWAQDLATVVDAANLLQGERKIRFVFVGEGTQKAYLQERAESLGLSNVEFLPLQSRDRHLGILKASDVCLISLKKRFDSPSVPSKSLDMMACGKPILANVPLTGDLAGLIHDADCGVVVEPEQPEVLASAIRRLFSDQDRRRVMGENGRVYLRTELSLERCLREYEAILDGLGSSAIAVERPLEV